MERSKGLALRRWLGALTATVILTSVPLLAPPAHADTVRGLSWHLDYLRIPRAHEITKGSGQTVVVVDSGVQASHWDLSGQVVTGRGFTPDAAPDGRIDPDTRVSHGTGMASLIAGRGGGQQRLLGVAPGAKILPASIGTGASDELAPAIRWAADQRPGVISISISPDGLAVNPDLASAVAYAQQRDVVVVASSGNEGSDLMSPLAALPGVVAVGAVDRKGAVWANSNRGPELAVTAPGVQVIMSVNGSTSPNGYGVGDGTSQATAIVSGVVALIRSRFPDLDAANVINRLVTTASDKGDKGRDPFYGFGVVDPVRALTADVPDVSANPLGVAAGGPGPGSTDAPEGGSGDESSDLGVSVRVDWGGLLPYALGCVAVVGGLVVLIVWLNRRRKRRRGPPYPPAGPPGQPPVPGPWRPPAQGGQPPAFGNPPPPAPHVPPPPG